MISQVLGLESDKTVSEVVLGFMVSIFLANGG